MLKVKETLSNALFFAGLIFISGTLRFWGFDFYVITFTILCLFLWLVNGVGENYLRLTQESALRQSIFQAIVQPPLAFFSIIALFYTITGEFYWLFWVCAGFISFILLVLPLTDIHQQITQRKQDK